MSGGSMEYLSYKIESAEFRENTVLRRALRAHLLKVAEALHAIEWNDSGDGHDGEDDLIRAVLAPEDTLRQAHADAVVALRDLQREVRRVEGKA